MYNLPRTSVRRGFTTIELLMSMLIMGILTSVVLANYPDSATRINLANITHSLALSVREAQVRGSAIDSASSTVGGYGMYFDTIEPTRFYLYADLANGTTLNGIQLGNGLYDISPFDETKTVTNLLKNFKITKLCVGTGFPFTSCNAVTQGGVPAIENITLSFIRPNPEPKIYINKQTSTTYSAACVEIVSPRGGGSGHVRSVHVFSSGRITTSQLGCQ